MRRPLHCVCTQFSRSFKSACSHVHDIQCNACRRTDEVIRDIELKTEGVSSPDLRRKLQFEHSKT